MRRTNRLLREYVREVLNEEMGGDYAGLGIDSSSMVGANPYGQSFGSGSELYNVFVKPFVDVVQTAAGSAKQLSASAQTVVKVGFEAIMTSLIPMLSDDYERLFANEKAKLDKIKGEYAAVYKSNWDAFKDHDFLLAAFMYRPDMFLDAKLAKQAPKVCASLLSILSGGALDNALTKVGAAINQHTKSNADYVSNNYQNAPKRANTGHTKNPVDMFGESVINEDDAKPKEQPTPPSGLTGLVTNEKVKAFLAKQPLVQKTSQVGQALVKDTLTKVYNTASQVMQAKDVGALQKAVGKKIKGIDEMMKLPANERQAAEQVVMSTTKKAAQSFYVKELEKHVQEAIKQGVPQNHPYVAVYQQVISKIKAL